MGSNTCVTIGKRLRIWNSMIFVKSFLTSLTPSLLVVDCWGGVVDRRQRTL